MSSSILEIMIGDFTWDVNSRTLTLVDENDPSLSHAQLVLTPKQYQLLKCLHEAHPNSVPNDQIIEKVWGTRHISPESLPQLIIRTRQAIGDHSKTIVVNEPGRGYSLTFKSMPAPSAANRWRWGFGDNAPPMRAQSVVYMVLSLLVCATGFHLWQAGQALYYRTKFIELHQVQPYPDLERLENGNIEFEIDSHECVFTKDKRIVQCKAAPHDPRAGDH